MTQLDLAKSFLEDADIQQKYGLTPDDVAQMMMNSEYKPDIQVLVSLIRQLVNVVEDSGTTVNLAAARLNAHLESTLR